MPIYSNSVINLLDSDDDGSILQVWDGNSDGNSVVVLDRHFENHSDDHSMEDALDRQSDDSSETIDKPARFGYDIWRKFQDMHPGRPNGMGFLLFGAPQTWSRPNFYHRWTNGRFLRNVVCTNRAKIKRIRELVIQDARENYDVDLTQGPYFAGLPVRVVMRFYRRLPNSAFVNEKRTNKLKQEWRNHIIGSPDIKRPDLDNMCKLIIDSLQGIVYSDDMYVVKIVAVKCFDYEFPYEGKTEIDVKIINEEDLKRIEEEDE